MKRLSKAGIASATMASGAARLQPVELIRQLLRLLQPPGSQRDLPAAWLKA